MWRIPGYFLLIVLFITSMPAFAQGETPPLTETHSISRYDLDFQYPSEWEIIRDDPSEVVFSTESVFASWVFDGPGDTAEEVATSLADEFLDADSNTFKLTETQSFEIAGRAAAQLDIVSDPALHQRFIGMEYEDTATVLIWLVGEIDQIDSVASTSIEMLATMRPMGQGVPEAAVLGDVPLPTLTHTRPADQITFEYPSTWVVTERDDYSLVYVPSDVNINIWREQIPNGIDTLEAILDYASELLVQELPDVPFGDAETFKLETGRAALRSAGVDAERRYEFWIIDIGDGAASAALVLGPPDAVAELESALLALWGSVGVASEDELAASVSNIVLSETISSEENRFTVDYPEGWVAFPGDGMILIATSLESLGSATEGLLPGDVFLMVDDGLGIIAGGGLVQEIPSDTSPDQVALAIQAVMGGQSQSEIFFEELTIGNRPAALVLSPEPLLDNFVLIFEAPDGSLASLIAIVPSGELDDRRPVLIAIAESLRLQ